MNHQEFIEQLNQHLSGLKETRLRIKFYQAVKSTVLGLKIQQDFKCPSSRFLSESFGISRDTIEKVYAQLEDEGLLYRIKGKGSFAYARPFKSEPTQSAVDYFLPPETEQLEALFFDQNLNFFADGMPEIRNFPFRKWYETEKHVLNQQGLSIFMKDNAAGQLLLCQEIAHMTNLNRHTQVSADQVLIVNSTQQAIYLCGRVLFSPGNRIVMEDPYYSNADHLFRHMNLELLYVNLDAEGIQIQSCEDAENISAVYVTPACQYPTGIQMSEQRKKQVIAFAQRKDAYIIEDDYDAFMLHKGDNRAIFASDQHQRTIYIGSFSKYMLPGVRLSYMILPVKLVEPFRRYRNYIDGSAPSQHMQHILGHFMKNGEYAVYLKKMQQIYIQRYHAFSHYFQQYLSEYCEIREHDPAMQVACYIKNTDVAVHLLEEALVKAAEVKGIAMTCLSQFYQNNPEYGFVLGFSSLNENEIRVCMIELARLIQQEIKRLKN